jgi:hypothetical protein
MTLTKLTFSSLALLAISSLGSAQVTIAWVAGKTGAWETAANWRTNQTPPVNRVPINGDTIRPGAAGITINISSTTGTQNLGNSALFQGAVTSTKIVQTGGTLNLNSLYLSSTKAAVAKGHVNYELRGGSLYADYRSTFTWDNSSDRASRFLQTGGSARFGAGATNGLNMAQKARTQQAYYDLKGGIFDSGYLKLGSAGSNQTAVFTQSGVSVALLRGTLYLGTVAGTTGRSVYNLDGGTLTMSATANAFVFTQPGAPAYFDFDGGTLNLRGTWNFTSLKGISNSDFRVRGKAATAVNLSFKAVTINGLAYTRISGCEASSSNYGTGLTGKSGVPTLSASAAPKISVTINLLASNSSGSTTQGLLLVGFSPLSIPFLGGQLLVAPPYALVNLVVPNGGVTLPVTVPNAACVSVFVQLMQLDTAATQGVSMTRGLRLNIGH